MRVTFWGTRGSCPTFPAPWEIREYADRISRATLRAVTSHLRNRYEGDTPASPDDLREWLQQSPEQIASGLDIEQPPVFGGETTCVEVETSEGNTLIFDWGSGIRHCGAKIMRERADTGLAKLYLFGSHQHLDHRIGLSFAGFCFAVPPFDIQVFGTAGVLRAMEDHFGFFSHTVSASTYSDDPIDYRIATATFRGVEIRALAEDGHSESGGLWAERDIAEPIRIGSTVVRPFQAYHGLTTCLGYKIEHGGKSFVFSTDHESLGWQAGKGSEPENAAVLRSVRANEELGRMCQGADLAYFDGQYSREEYHGRQSITAMPPVARVGWGHGCIEDILERVRETGVKHALIGHHDPERSWPAQLTMNEELRELSKKSGFRVELARDGQIVEL